MYAVIFAGPSLPYNCINFESFSSKVSVFDSVSAFFQSNPYENGRETPFIAIFPPILGENMYKIIKICPKIVGIIDGYRENVAAIWHREILYAMSQGINVFGASGVGALRAAELYGFGMKGCGRVFELCRDGMIDSDDEIAVTHGPKELGYKVFSDAMVNIRCTLDAAKNDGVIDDHHYRLIKEVAEKMHYKERTYDSIKDNIERCLISHSSDMLNNFFCWVDGSGKVDVKQEDAILLLNEIDMQLNM